MGPKEWGSISGQIIKQRYTDLYNTNPNYCKQCGKKIEIREGTKPAAAKRKKFCNRSCAASYNNTTSPKRSKATHSSCQKCGEEIPVTRHPSGGYSTRRYCIPCRQKVRYEKGQAYSANPLRSSFELATKGEVRERTKDSQRMRVYITKHARIVYKRTGRPYICLCCGYTLHVHICHVKDIQEFPDEALVKEINHPDNLITLCPTHHWEFDHGYWKMPK
jgi:hypothetical protein